MSLTVGDRLQLLSPVSSIQPGQRVPVRLPDGTVAAVCVEAHARSSTALGLLWVESTGEEVCSDMPGMVEALINEAVNRVLERRSERNG